MPKHEITHPPGSLTPEDLRDLLQRYFEKKDIARLERLGGRILITLTIPYNPRTRGGPKDVEIDAAFVNQLRELRGKPTDLRKQLGMLSVKQLTTIAELIGHPLRTNISRQALVEELVTSVRGEEIWKKISGKTGPDLD